MKRFVILSIFLAGTTFAFAQQPPRGAKNDPSYSVRNYKHANKAAVAKEFNLDKVTTLENVTTSDNSDYKHQSSAKRTKAKLAPYTGTTHPARSNKHPLG